MAQIFTIIRQCGVAIPKPVAPKSSSHFNWKKSNRGIIRKTLRMANRDINFKKHYSNRAVSLRVLLDMDQVLCNFEGDFLEQFKKKYPEEPHIELKDREGFFLRDQYDKLKPGLATKCSTIYNAKGFFNHLKEIQGAVNAAKELWEMEGVDVFICTSPTTNYKYCLREKYQWVEKHLGREWVDRILLVRDKTMANGHLLIDDKAVITGANPYPTWEHVVFTAPHNVHTDIKGKTRLDNWTDGTWRDLIEDFKKKI